MKLKVPAKSTIRKFRRLAIPVQVAILVVGAISLSSGVFASVFLLRDPGTGNYTLDDGLVGRWKMDGNTNDSGPYGKTATANNATLTTDRSGNSNSAYSLTGASNSNISTPNNVSPRFIESNNAPFSISFWFRATRLPNVGTYEQILLSSNETYLTSGYRLGLQDFNSNLYLALWSNQSGGTLSVEVVNPSISINTWYHLTITYNGSGATMYLNGSSVATGSGTIIANTNNVVIGGGTGGVSYLLGSVDDFRLYNRAINSTEVSQIYAGIEAGGGGSPADINIKLARGHKGMVGQWKMNGNAKDASPYGGDGTVSGATLTTDRKDNPNKAYAFNGSSHYISVPDTTRLEFSGDYTVSAWMKTSSSGTQTLLAKYAGTASDQYYLSISSGVATFRSGSTSISGGSSLADGAWHLVTGVKSGSTGYLYVDGVQVGTSAVSGTTTGGTSYLGIGKYGSSGTNYFNGSLDDIRIYSRSLTSDEIVSIRDSYEANLSIAGDFGTTALGSSLVGRWQMTGNANDATPYSNNGTVSGASLTTDRFGTSNSAYSFNGTSNQISIPNPVPNFISSNNAPFSMSIWLRPSNVTTSNHRSIVGNETYNVRGFRYGINSSQRFSFWTSESGGNLHPIQSTTSAIINTWYHVVVTYDGSVVKIYVNGNPEVASASGRTIISGTNNLVLAGGTGGVDRFAGVMDDFRTWSRALNVQEVQAIYGNN